MYVWNQPVYPIRQPHHEACLKQWTLYTYKPAPWGVPKTQVIQLVNYLRAICVILLGESIPGRAFVKEMTAKSFRLRSKCSQSNQFSLNHASPFVTSSDYKERVCLKNQPLIRTFVRHKAKFLLQFCYWFCQFLALPYLKCNASPSCDPYQGVSDFSFTFPRHYC